MHWSHVYAWKAREHPRLFKRPSYENTTKLSIPLFEHTARLTIPSELQGRRSGQPAGPSIAPGDQKAETPRNHTGWGQSWGCGAEPGGEEAAAATPGRQSASRPSILVPPQTPPGGWDAAHRPRRLPPTAPSPTLTLQQPLDDAVDVELVYIRHRLSGAGRSPPRRSARGLAGPTPLLVLSRFCPFLLCAFPRSLCPPPPPQHGASTEQNGRRPLSGLAWRTDTTSATRPVGNPL